MRLLEADESRCFLLLVLEIRLLLSLSLSLSLSLFVLRTRIGRPWASYSMPAVGMTDQRPAVESILNLNIGIELAHCWLALWISFWKSTSAIIYCTTGNNSMANSDGQEKQPVMSSVRHGKQRPVRQCEGGTIIVRRESRRASKQAQKVCVRSCSGAKHESGGMWSSG